MSFVFFIPSMSCCVISRDISLGFVFGNNAAFSQICFAVPEPTLENSAVRKLCSVVDFVYLSIVMSMPISTPYGCG